ncbi:MAG: bifunctional (p)ppGpp synthetase/guanosine-3',5'-bis(diphosphate) 3'-pyrophosphohydrolase [Desulfobacteraceae bacterium]|jgi:GTP pyrophosphokinase|nr:MAG: bifunctional (p)ppGpp synthetase/guanosine-3',5'-bis(diphosphate) 3'-pyrophosphohydrolase [Desulfobacteraceae bacterium]
MIRITEIIDKIYDYYPDADTDIVDRAYIYSAKVHEGQRRLSGEPYLSHPLEVASLLADMKLDAVSIACGLLHDVVEDTHATIEDIRRMFGEDAARIIAGVTKISTLSFETARARQAENIRQMILAMANDIRVILIKLADRLHNIRTLQFHQSDKKRKEIAQETLDIYAPIAARLGIFWIKHELEEISFSYTNPDAYEEIQQKIRKSRIERDQFVEEVKKTIETLMAEADIACQVDGRNKQIYSIHQKMIQQNLSFEQVYDIIAFRVIVATIPRCYEAMGRIHSKWKPIHYKIKDYISLPKPNGYQSIHTTVIGPHGERMEVQIRTFEMDRVAESGIAAHWSYKEGKKIDEESSSAFAWIQNLVEHQETSGDPEEFLANVTIDLFPKDIFVFTPKGRVMTLPKGATPVDFAYSIHSEVGHQCTGARVNGRLVPLQYQLRNGEIVEIITTKGHNPSTDWLSFVKSSRAKNRIRQWIKKQESEISIALGRDLCEKAFRKHKLNFNELVNTPAMETIATEFNFKTVEDLIANVGYGKLTPLQLIRKLLPDAKPKREDSLLEKLMSKRKDKKKQRDEDGIEVDGIDDLLIRFGKCCQPIPGDPITGYITQGAGLSIHRKGCVNTLKLNPERQVSVKWKTASAKTFPIRLKLRCYDRPGLLADISAVISQMEANIVDVNLESNEDKMVGGYFTLGVKDLDHLENVLARLRKIEAVQEIIRE